MAAPQATEHVSEKTFRAYTNAQGSTYARARKGYHPNLFKRIVDHHTSTGGQLNTLVDVGCGPGTATLALAPYFAETIGLDPSEGMIAAARQQLADGRLAQSHTVQFECSSAEELDASRSIVPDGTVDLITAATAAHWFDMTKFWPRAAQLLRPGGTVALWTGNFTTIHPSVPNAEAMSKACTEIEERELLPYMEAGNILARELYVSMPLPWTMDPPVPAFDQASFLRKEWGTPGHDDAEAEGQEFFFNGQHALTLPMIEVALGTASRVTRWREANPDKAGTEHDPVKMMTAQVARHLHEAGVPAEQHIVKGRVTGVLLMVKKKKV